MFLAVVFFVKRGLSPQKKANNNPALVSIEGKVLEELVNKDSDLDGVLDWEEGLFGTDPHKKDTDEDGVADDAEIENLKSQAGKKEKGGPLLELDEKNLTETDKFSREFFSTVATLNQNGVIDQAVMDQLGTALAQRIQNSTPRKIYQLSEIKIIKDDSIKAIQTYGETLINMQSKYAVKHGVTDVLRKFIVDEENVDVGVLSELDPIISQKNKLKNAMVKMGVPQSIATLHLNVINSLEILVENVRDIQLYDTDVILSLSAISQYEENTDRLNKSLNNLGGAINQKLSR